jgi:hypothetical protein
MEVLDLSKEYDIILIDNLDLFEEAIIFCEKIIAENNKKKIVATLSVEKINQFSCLFRYIFLKKHF